MAQHIALDQLAILFVMGNGMRTGADDGHAALQHIDELWQLIKRCSPQEAADGSEPRVIALGLHDFGSVFGDRHGAEFPDFDGLAIQTVAFLAENDRAR